MIKNINSDEKIISFITLMILDLVINWIPKRLKKLLGKYFIRFKQNKVQLNQFMID
jgi:hypothetical protein